MNQTTLKNIYSFEGKGLHTGKFAKASLKPAGADTGIVIVRTDLGGARIPALASSVASTRRSTLLRCGKAKAGTVEHVMSALTGLGVDNAVIELDGPEMPILDGSAAPYVAAISRDGLQTLDAPRRWVEVKKEIIVRGSHGSWIKITPAVEPSYEITIDFPSRFPGKQTVSYREGDDYSSEIAPCRTFCFLREVWPMLVLGLARGGDVENAIVIVDRKVPGWRLKCMAKMLGQPCLEVRPEGYLSNITLHFPDECGRHKLLDVIGDLRLGGGLLKARVEAYKPGHALNTAAAKAIFNQI